MMKLFATCTAGFEALVKQELQSLGYDTKTQDGGVQFAGDWKDVYRCNLHLRTADRILIQLAKFTVTSYDALFNQVEALKWDEWLAMDSAFPVTARSIKSKLHSPSDLQAITKKAIVTNLQNFYHRRTRLPETGAIVHLDLRLRDNIAVLFLDTTGDSLFKRGYRVEHGGAPLKENFAAGLISLTPWHGETPFVDPTTGSGTIAIEAAMFARKIAPGSYRHFAFEGFKNFNKQQWENLKNEAKAAQLPALTAPIFAYDIDQNMVQLAKVNAQRAGVLHDITFKQQAVKDFTTTLENGILVANPPYGVRLGDQQKARQLYRDMGTVFRPLTTWSIYAITSDLEFETYYGQKATKKRKLYNGRIRTDYFQYWGKPHFTK